MENVSGKKNRIEWIDTARGIGIILVILGHIGFGRFNQWIYSFHLPLFVFLSGLLFNPKVPFKTLIKKRVKSLIIPYFCFGVIIMIEEMISYSRFDFDYFICFIRDLVIQRRFRFIWFITFIFVIEIGFYLLQKAIKNKVALGIVVFALSAAVYVHNFMTKNALVWNADASIFMLPVFYIGAILADKIDRLELFLKKYYLLLVLAGLAVSTASVFLLGNTMELFDVNFGIPIVNYISALAGIAFVVVISFLTRNTAFDYIGKNSLSYYLTHLYIAFPITSSVMSTFNITINEYDSFIHINMCKLIFLFLTIIMCTTIDWLLKAMKCNFIIGK